MQEEVVALRDMVKELKAKVDRYEAVLTEIATGPVPNNSDFREPEDVFASRAQALAKAALAP